MKKLSVLLIGLAVATPAMLQAAGGVAGSPHDFSTNSIWNTRKGVCTPCHQAHHTDEAQLAPLWAHATSTADFTPYDSPTMNATPGDPAGVSLACLSCHDGTVAINQSISGSFLGRTNEVSPGVPENAPVFIAVDAQIGPDLHTTHPVSFTYDTALATADGGLEDPATYTIGTAKTNLTVTVAPVPTSWAGTSLTGQTIDEAMLIGGRMECASCHDVHRQEGSSPSSGILARISGYDSTGRGSLLCRTCHTK